MEAELHLLHRQTSTLTLEKKGKRVLNRTGAAVARMRTTEREDGRYLSRGRKRQRGRGGGGGGGWTKGRPGWGRPRRRQSDGAGGVG